MKLGIDLDGVVCDFPLQANAYLAGELGVPPIKVDRWDWYEGYGPDVKPVWQRLWDEEVQKGFFSTVPEAPGAIDGLGQLRDRGHQLVFITARPLAAGEDTQTWLDERGFGGHHLIVCPKSKSKQFTDPDILLDDKGDTVYRQLSVGKSSVLFKRPWNRDWWSRVPSVSGWSEFVQLVDAIGQEEVGNAHPAR